MALEKTQEQVWNNCSRISGLFEGIEIEKQFLGSWEQVCKVCSRTWIV